MPEPWNWYAGQPVPNPTPPFRLPEDQAGPVPPVGAVPLPGLEYADEFYGPPSEPPPPPKRQGRKPPRKRRAVP